MISRLSQLINLAFVRRNRDYWRSSVSIGWMMLVLSLLATLRDLRLGEKKTFSRSTTAATRPY